jgi:hypothetical protein
VHISMGLSTGPPIVTTSVSNPSPSWRFRKISEYLEWEFAINIGIHIRWTLEKLTKKVTGTFVSHTKNNAENIKK